jgi:glucose-1-phosphate thymidylyltransferase
LKGVILHGGAGTRLRPLTFTGPKQLIPIANKPTSQYVLEDLVRAGIKEIAIVLGKIYPEKVVECYGEGSKFGAEITYVNQGEPHGIAHAVKICKDFIGDDRFIVYLGDNMIKGGIANFTKRFERSEADAMILLSKVKDPSHFGVAEFNVEGKLVRLIEKPKIPPSNLALAGIYFFSPAIFVAISEIKPSRRGELEITDAIQMLMDKGYTVAHDVIKGWWKDTGKAEDIIEANSLVLDELEPKILGQVEDELSLHGRIGIGKDSLIKQGARLRGPIIIGEGTVIEATVYIGPYTSIGDHCTVKRGEIENSIIMNNSVIDVQERIVDSLIGPDSRILSNENNMPRGRRFVLGASSSVLL